MLAVRAVSVTPPGAREPVARDVSFQVGAGEWLAVTGPNGCGKSSILIAAAGLWPTSGGMVEVDGVPLVATPTGRAAARIAAVLQDPSSQLFERSAGEEVAFTVRNLGLGEPEVTERAREWSARLGLERLLDRDPRQLSAGQQQRVLLAAALATRPRFLLADEGTAHLDRGGRAEVLRIVRDEQAKGLGVLWVTQEVDELAAADRVLRLELAAAHEPASGSPAPDVTAASPAPGAPIRIRIAPASESTPGPRISVDSCIEFEVGPGRPVALIGPNGSGKSVTLEALAGTVTCPQVTWESQTAAPAHAPVLLAQYPELQVFGDTVREEVSFGLRQRGAAVEEGVARAAQMLVYVGLGREVIDRSPWALSSGERRLVQAIAILTTPASLLLLDEPTCGLDPLRASGLLDLIAQAARRTPVLVATQDPGVIPALGATPAELGSVSSLRPSYSGKMD